MLFTLVALNSQPGCGSSPHGVQAAAPDVKISVDFVFSNPVKPPATNNV